MVGCLLGLAAAGESEAVGLKIDGGLFGVGRADGEGDVVLFGVGGGGTLGPED